MDHRQPVSETFGFETFISCANRSSNRRQVPLLLMQDVLYDEEEKFEIAPQTNILHQDPMGKSSPDKNRVASGSSPLEDAIQFQLVRRMFSTLKLPSVLLEETSHLIVDILGNTSAYQASLPFLEGLWQPVKSIWSVPSSCQPMAENAVMLYRILYKGFSFFRVQSR